MFKLRLLIRIWRQEIKWIKTKFNVRFDLVKIQERVVNINMLNANFW